MVKLAIPLAALVMTRAPCILIIFQVCRAYFQCQVLRPRQVRSISVLPEIVDVRLIDFPRFAIRSRPALRFEADLPNRRTARGLAMDFHLSSRLVIQVRSASTMFFGSMTTTGSSPSPD